MVTVGVSNVEYLAPIHHGEIVEITAAVTANGRSSVHVAVEMIAEELLNGTRRLTGRGSFGLVAVDDQAAPKPITHKE